jgi:hypothetical protein
VAELRHLGHAQHFIAARSCWFRLGTAIGDRYVVSTVGEYYPIGSDEMEKLGWDRLYETYVFRSSGGVRDCGCPEINEYSEMDSQGYNDAAEAERGHAAMVRKWSDILDAEVQP